VVTEQLSSVAACAAAGLLVGWLLADDIDRVIARQGGRRARVSCALVALVTSGLFAAVAWRFGWSWELPAYLVLCAFAVVLCFVDLGTKTLPRRLVYATGAGGVVLLALPGLVMGEFARVGWAVFTTLVALFALWLMHLAARGALGFGDVRFGAVLAWYLAWQAPRYVPAAIVLAFVLSSVVGVLLLVGRRVGRRTAIPFGPFLALAALVVIVGGSSLVDGVWRA
jgi:leader peptidase (prepilin peptidase) / N-methyltransferase